jgi:hypothetical protein
MKNSRLNLFRDLAVIALSVGLAVLLARAGVVADLLSGAASQVVIGSVLSGMFFVSVFTAAPAVVVLMRLVEANSLWEVAFFGALGALLGDFLIFRFVKDTLVQDLRAQVSLKTRLRFALLGRRGLFRWLMPAVGALLVASPLPDELGLALLGFSKIRTALFLPLSFTLNLLGLLALLSLIT